MATDQAVRPASAHTPAHRRPAVLHAERASARLAMRQIWFGALIVAAWSGVLLWLGTAAFDKARGVAGASMAVLADNPAFRAIYGLPTAVDTKGGFAIWRVQIFVVVIGAVWVSLATTRVLRGNEEAGRFDLMLATPLSLIGATVASLVAVLGAPLLIAVVAGSVLQGFGGAAAGAWLYAAGLGLLLATFVMVAALASQFVPDRRRATGIAAAVLFITFVLRMYADGSKDAGWVRWATPFGWVEQLHAFGGNDLLPLAPLIGAPVVLAAAALMLAHRRDTGAGLLAASDNARASTRLLSSPLAFSVRHRLGDVVGWGLGVAALGLLTGGLANSFVGFGQTNPEYVATLAKFGMGAAVTVSGFVALMDVFVAVVLAGYAVACVHGDYEDEIATRLDLPYATRVTRTTWAGSTLTTTAAALAVLTIVLAFTNWAGSAISGAGLSGGEAFAAAFNVLPVPILFLGLAVLLHGVLPTWTAGLGGGLAIGLYMVNLIGPALSWPSWVLDLSPYHQLALVPADSPAWPPIGYMLGIAVVMAAVGLVGYARRDLR